jgi:hypothetical protein
MPDFKTFISVFMLATFTFFLMSSVSCTTNLDYHLGATSLPPSPEIDIWIDSFVQVGAYESIDILWVIDGSCSMNNNDTELLLGIEAMMNNLPTDINWRLKMITAGAFGSYTQATTFPLTQGATYADALNMYNQLPNDGGEAGFGAVENYVLNDAYAQTWLRRSAALLVVFVSDEKEQSLMTVNDFLTWYETLRNSVYVASIVNVDPVNSVCVSSPSSIDTGYRYIEAANYFKGNVIDICASDWSSGVEEATSKINPYDRYTLQHLPQDDTLVVFENGVPLYGWRYESSDNTIYFDVIPAEGVLIEIGYSIEEYIIDNIEDSGIIQ